MNYCQTSNFRMRVFPRANSAFRGREVDGPNTPPSTIYIVYGPSPSPSAIAIAITILTASTPPYLHIEVCSGTRYLLDVVRYVVVMPMSLYFVMNSRVEGFFVDISVVRVRSNFEVSNSAHCTHSTLHTPHSTLHTPHSTLLHTSHSTASKSNTEQHGTPTRFSNCRSGWNRGHSAVSGVCVCVSVCVCSLSESLSLTCSVPPHSSQAAASRLCSLSMVMVILIGEFYLVCLGSCLESTSVVYESL